MVLRALLSRWSLIYVLSIYLIYPSVVQAENTPPAGSPTVSDASSPIAAPGPTTDGFVTGSFFLTEGGNDPPPVNPSKLDGATGSNSSRKAIGSGPGGRFDFGLNQDTTNSSNTGTGSAPADDGTASGTGSSEKRSIDFPVFNPFAGTKIVGGNQVSKAKALKEYPFYVLWDGANCGGSLIWDDVFLTAAHCGIRDNLQQLLDTMNTVYMLLALHPNPGLHQSGPPGEGLERTIVDVRTHPTYGQEGTDRSSDARVVRLSESALVDPSGSPTEAALVTINDNSDVPRDGAALQAVGFGLQEETGKTMSATLQDVTLYAISNEQCDAQWGNNGQFQEVSMLCSAAPGKDTCMGDSGSPIMDKASSTQVGIVSFGAGCAKEKSGINTRVSSLTSWIHQNVCEMSRVPPATCYPSLAKWEGTDCLGVLVAADVVLTAGHCGHWDTDPFSSREISFVSVPGLVRSIVERKVHPDYNYYTRDFDLQLLKLSKTALFDDEGLPTGVSTVPLYKSTQTPTSLNEIGLLEKGNGFVSTARGSVGDKSAISESEPRLQQVTVYPVSSESACPYWNMVAHEHMMCSLVAKHGDSPQAVPCDIPGGAPLFTEEGQVAGIASWGKDCSAEGLSGVSAKVSPAASWIEGTVCSWTSSEIPNTIICESVPQGQNGFERNGPGLLDVTIQHDRYSEEVAWTLTNVETSTELYYQAYDSVHEPHSAVTETFGNLPEGHYQFEIADSENDGLCCEFGVGSVVISDAAGEPLWVHNGGYNAYHSVKFHVDSDGNAVAKDDQDTYVSSGAITTQQNYMLYTRDPSEFDPLWPGVYPQTLSKLVVNVKLDLFPSESRWKLLGLSPGKDFEQDSDWETLMDVQGYHSLEVTSETVDVEPGGIYRFQIFDSESDGICCRYKNGFITMTTKKSGKEKEVVVWRHNGDFKDYAEIYLQVKDDGEIQAKQESDLELS